jgi:hypothetical protein
VLTNAESWTLWVSNLACKQDRELLHSISYQNLISPRCSLRILPSSSQSFSLLSNHFPREIHNTFCLLCAPSESPIEPTVDITFLFDCPHVTLLLIMCSPPIPTYFILLSILISGTCNSMVDIRIRRWINYADVDHALMRRIWEV